MIWEDETNTWWKLGFFVALTNINNCEPHRHHSLQPAINSCFSFSAFFFFPLAWIPTLQVLNQRQWLPLMVLARKWENHILLPSLGKAGLRKSMTSFSKLFNCKSIFFFTNSPIYTYIHTYLSNSRLNFILLFRLFSTFG